MFEKTPWETPVGRTSWKFLKKTFNKILTFFLKFIRVRGEIPKGILGQHPGGISEKNIPLQISTEISANFYEGFSGIISENEGISYIILKKILEKNL